MVRCVIALLLVLPAPLPAAAQQTGAAASREDPAVSALALKLYGQARSGTVDRSVLTEEMSAQLTPEVLTQAKPLLDQLGDPKKIVFVSAERHTKGILYAYVVTFAAAEFRVKVFVHPDGKFAGYGFEP